MKAVVDCAASSAGELLLAGRPGALLNLVDRPFLQHVVEYLVGAGLVDIDFVVDQPRVAEFEQMLGDGTRWGSRFGPERRPGHA